MIELLDWLSRYERIGEISLVHALLALSTFAALSAGLLSVANIPVAGVAGFASALLINRLGLPVEVVIILGGVIGGVTALAISYPILRLTSHWIALGTIALVLIFRVIVMNLPGVTGGINGTAIPRSVQTWQLVLILLAAMWFFGRMRRSRFGLAAEAVRADPAVASALGVPTPDVRRAAFVQSGAIAGVAGVLFANLLQFVAPETYYVELSFLVLAAVVLGGSYHWLGAVVGALVFTALPEVTRAFLTTGQNIATGVLLIAIILFLPGGLVEPGRRQRREGARQALEEARREIASGAAVGGHPAETVAAPDSPDVPALPTPASPARQDPSGAFETMVEVRHVTKRFGGLTAVNDLSFTVARGTLTAVIGPNGAGKSTLLNMISGLDAANEGHVLVDGQDVTYLPAHERARRGVARTFQNVRLFRGLTVLENIIVGEHLTRSTQLWEAVAYVPRERRERKRAEDRARELMDRVGIIGKPEQFAGTLSYANQRRAEIARALASDPRVLLLDEPTAGMHKHGSRALGDLLRQLQGQGLTIVLIEHNLELVLDYCERAIVMDFGQFLADGAPRACLDDPVVREAYFGRKSDADRIESLIALRQH